MAVKRPAGKGKRRPTAAPRMSVRINVVDETGRSGSIPLKTTGTLRAAAWRWSYALRNRERWASREDAKQRQGEDVRALIRDFGVSAASLTKIADAGVVEVSMPFVAEEEGWEYRIFPWEYALASATNERRPAGRDFTVVRHLARPQSAGAGPKPCFLYVESAPVRALSEGYDFSGERKMVKAAAAAAGLSLVELVNPTLAKLTSTVRRERPTVAHLTGFDTHQGRSLLNPTPPPPDEDRETLDGFLLADGRGGSREVSALALGQALTVDGASPDLVICNFFYSAPRTAALCVGLGAGAAIGFQDTFDDTLAELFFATFYRAWNLSKKSAVSAFSYAWHQVRAQGRRTTGTGLVLWNGHSIVERAARSVPKLQPVKEVARLWRNASAEPVTPASARADLRVTVKHLPQLNYSILHNNRPLFETFTIEKTRDGIAAVDGLQVSIELGLGLGTPPFRLQVSIPVTQASIDIADQIRVSLASTLSRAIRESLQTSLFIEVCFENVVLFRETRRVTLLAVDEWQDSDEHRKWLPSFVLPRDPAVSRIIDLSQRYLQALTDDPTAGFDGYQSVEVIDRKRRKYDCTGVDLQVRAIWSALLFDTPLSYINPPPTFTDSSQRLRSPSDIIDGRRGTCIDLALLLASCLEYVEIYPAIVLLTDHAFPCYWRAEEYFDEFSLARSSAVDAAGAGLGAHTNASLQTDSWYYMKDHFREVLGEIAAGRLVPVESTCLCWRNSFAEACDQGRKNLGRRSHFDSMLDVRSARTDEDSPVTPLPLLREEA